MKKYRFFSLLLAALLAVSLTVPALALEGPQTQLRRRPILVDGDNGEVLYEHNGYERTLPRLHHQDHDLPVVLEAIDAGELALDGPDHRLPAGHHPAPGQLQRQPAHPGRGDPHGGAAALLRPAPLRQRGVQHSGPKRWRAATRPLWSG